MTTLSISQHGMQSVCQLIINVINDVLNIQCGTSIAYIHTAAQFINHTLENGYGY